MTWTSEHGWAVLVGIASVGVVFASGVGSPSAGQITGSMAHHYAHIVLPTLAFGIFVGGVVTDIRRNGWPSFSWRL